MTQTVQAALIAGTQRLRTAGIEGGNRDAQVLMSGALGVPIDRLILAMQDNLNQAASATYDDFIKRRAAGEPVSHILGQRLFYNRSFRVTRDVLDPRPETEILVFEALKEDFKTVLDLGTGSGAIIISLLCENAGATGTATDVSDQALQIAAENAAALGVAERLTFLPSNWFQAVDGQFDLIVSNPPYIALDEMDGLQPEVRDFEPELALTDRADGLSAYRSICADAISHCSPGGRLLVEIGPTQAAAVSALMAKGGFAEIGVINDFDGRNRVISARKPMDWAENRRR